MKPEVEIYLTAFGEFECLPFSSQIDIWRAILKIPEKKDIKSRSIQLYKNQTSTKGDKKRLFLCATGKISVRLCQGTNLVIDISDTVHTYLLCNLWQFLNVILPPTIMLRRIDKSEKVIFESRDSDDGVYCQKVVPLCLPSTRSYKSCKLILRSRFFGLMSSR